MKKLTILAISLLFATISFVGLSQTGSNEGDAFSHENVTFTSPSCMKVARQLSVGDLLELRRRVMPTREEDYYTGGPTPYIHLTELDLGEATLVDGELPDSIFANTFLMKIILPSNTTKIGKGAFYNSFLREIDIPASVQCIDEGAFTMCHQLERVNLPNNLETIPDNLFWRCISLKELNIPSSLKYLGNNAFAECYNLPSNAFVFPNTLEYLGSAFLFNKNFKQLIIPENVQEMGWYDFNYNLQRVEIKSNKITKLPDYAFDGCSSLSQVILNEGLKEIGDEAFRYCTVKKLVLPSTLENIGEAAFRFNPLEEVILPKALKTISSCAFEGCGALLSIYSTSTTPPAMGKSWIFGGNPFSNIDYDKATLYVPKGCRDAYAQSEIFKVFSNIVELNEDEWPATGVSEVTVSNANDNGKYMINGQVVIRHAGQLFNVNGQQLK